MAKPFTIFLHAKEITACNWFRHILPTRHCGKRLGDSIQLVCGPSLDEEMCGADAVSIHGMPSGNAPLRYSRWISQGRKVICSFDDNYREIPEYNPVSKIFKPDQYAALYYTERNASAIVCSTQPLADSLPKRPSGAPYARTFVCPNLLEPSMYATADRDASKPLQIIWCGSNTHRGDLDEIVEPITNVLKKHNLKTGREAHFIFWGDTHPEIRARHLMRGVFEIPGRDLIDYYGILQQQLSPDIWLCPLKDNKFGHSKSCLKAIEGMATGAAVVASPTLPYASVIRHGENGLLARTEQEWTDALLHLIEDDKYRLAVAAAGIQEVHDRWSWENTNCPGIEAWVRMFATIPDLR